MTSVMIFFMMPLVDYSRSLTAAAVTFREAERIQHPVRRLLHELARVGLKKYRKAVSSTRRFMPLLCAELTGAKQP